MTTRMWTRGRSRFTHGNGIGVGRRRRNSWDPGEEVAGLPLPTHEVPATFGTPVERDQASQFLCLSTTGRHVTLASCRAPKLSHPHADESSLLQRPCQAPIRAPERRENHRKPHWRSDLRFGDGRIDSMSITVLGWVIDWEWVTQGREHSPLPTRNIGRVDPNSIRGRFKP